MSNKTIDTGSEILEIDPQTGEILLSANRADFKQVQQTKIKALQLLNQNDFIMINGTWEAKRDGLLKILTSLPVSYSWIIKESETNDQYAKIMGTLTIQNGTIARQADSMGICEKNELKGNGGLHFMNARAETRALKRAIETLFGSVINYYVVNYMKAA